MKSHVFRAGFEGFEARSHFRELLNGNSAVK